MSKIKHKKPTMKNLLLILILGFIIVFIAGGLLPKEYTAVFAILCIAYVGISLWKIFSLIVYAIKQRKAKNQALPVENNSASTDVPQVETVRQESIEFAKNNITIIAADSFLECPSDYIAFDLETTGINPDSNEIIEIGAVKVHDNQVVSTFQKLVNPSCPVPPEASRINHISNVMLENAPDIATALPAFVDFIGECHILIAHNAHFDAGFLTAAADKQQITLRHSYVDTVEIAAKRWPELPNKKLGTVASHIGFTNPQAHRALGDAQTVHQIVQAALFGIPEKQKAESSLSLQERLTEETKLLDNKLEGLRFCFTGEFDGCSRSDIERLVAIHGGKTTGAVSGKTDYLVVGEYDETYGEGYVSGKQKKAQEIIDQGGKVQIIDQEEFEALLL
ncbi:MAG: 3'-5' exoribonuclease [Clostridia bacterium]|nr:3'-5' exoribonuclease [Clostridia bacterium]